MSEQPSTQGAAGNPPANQDPKAANQGGQAAKAAEVPGPIQKGEKLLVVVMTGGPQLARLPGIVTRVHKPASADAAPLVDVETMTHAGVPIVYERLGPEGPHGSHLNGGCTFPVYARRA